MSASQERILIVEDNPEVSDLIARQVLQPLGYRVEVIKDAATAIKNAVELPPDLVITNLNLPGLSGKDLLAALSSQETEIPVVIIANKGQVENLLQAFRLGASDFLLTPIREAEVVSVVERMLKQVRVRRDKESLAALLDQTNRDLQQRLRELTTIFTIGKCVISPSGQRSLFNKIIEGAISISGADGGWLLLRPENDAFYLLSACHNLPESFSEKLNQPWDDEVSALVRLSGEPLSLHGKLVYRYQISQIWQSILVVPIKLDKELMGTLVVVRNNAIPFNRESQSLLEETANYAAISIATVRLFWALEEKVETLQQSMEEARARSRMKDDALIMITSEIKKYLSEALDAIVAFSIEGDSKLKAKQKNLVQTTQENLLRVSQIIKEIEVLIP